MDEQSLPPQQSLLLIESMINKAKNRFSENGFLYLLWGVVIFCNAITHFLLIKFTHIKQPELVWLTCILAAAVQVFYIWRNNRNRTVKTYTEEMIDHIWLYFGISMLLISFISIRFSNWMQMYPIILMLYGIPTSLSGSVMRFTPLKLGGGFCFLLSILSTYCMNEYILLLLAAAVCAAWIVPGIILKAKHKRQRYDQR
jgi:hypothetical protein